MVLRGGLEMKNVMIYLDSYTLQSDLRIRLPKSAIENIGAMPGKTQFDIYIDVDDKSLVIKKRAESEKKKDE